MVTRSKSFGPTALTADTQTTIGSEYQFSKSGTIKKIRVNGYQGVTDKAESGFIYLFFKNISGPFEFAMLCSSGEITVGGKRQTEEVDVDIPYTVGEAITVKGLASEALEDVCVSITLVE